MTYAHITGTEFTLHPRCPTGLPPDMAPWMTGEAVISWDDLDRLLHEQGEACIPMWRMK